MAKQSERKLSSDLGPNFSRSSNFHFGVLPMFSFGLFWVLFSLPFARAAGLEMPDVRPGVLVLSILVQIWSSPIILVSSSLAARPVAKVNFRLFSCFL
jgi:hypothetical protein